MKAIEFQIDRKLSAPQGCLHVRCLFDGQCKKDFSPFSLRSLDNNQDRFALQFLIKESEKHNNTFGRAENTSESFKIPNSKSYQALRLLAATGHLFFEGKQLVCDLFGKPDFYLMVHENNSVAGIVSYKGTEFNVKECDLLCKGPPHWYIKGINLKFLPSSLSWSLLKKLYSDDPCGAEILPEDDEEDAPRVVYRGGIQAAVELTKEPLPVLILSDRTGAFANLWMNYGDGEKVPFNDSAVPLSSKNKRRIDTENSWEKDLLETDFSRKMMEGSHYYCPLDKVAKSLTFLLEIGWEIQDRQGNKILRNDGVETSLSEKGNNILIKGRASYRKHNADLADVVGAFNRRERFLSLGEGIVGLLPDNPEQMGISGLDEGVIDEGAIMIRKNQSGCIAELFSKAKEISPALVGLRERLEHFRDIRRIEPGAGFCGVLRPYQQEGLNWLHFLYEYGFHGILADDMGLGKTIQTLAFLSTLDKLGVNLIVTPTSLLFNWVSEIRQFFPEKDVCVLQKASNEKDLSADIILTSYTTLRLNQELFASRHFNCVILDEAQAVKNPDSQTSQAVRNLSATFRLSITGTPVENNLMELWSHFQFLMPDLLGDKKQFEAQALSAAVDSRHLQRIRKKIKPFVLRRKKEEVAKDLPEKVEQVVWVEMDPEQRRYYDDFLARTRTKIYRELDGGVIGNRIEILEAILRLRQICCHPLLTLHGDNIPMESVKEEALLQDIEELINEDRKGLIYSQFTGMLQLLAKKIREKGWKFSYLDGSTKDRKAAVEEFQEDPETKLFLISLKAGGVGLNLTAADYVFLFDPWWNDAVENQAISRAHRIGRKDTVFAKRYICRDTIEEKMLLLKKRKSGLVEELMGDRLSGKISEEDLLYLVS